MPWSAEHTEFLEANLPAGTGTGTLVEAYGGKLWLAQAECGGVHVGFSAPACLPI